MMATSRNDGYSDETIIDTATVITVSGTSRSGNRAQVHVGVTPKANMKISTTIRFSSMLNSEVSTIASGITSRGNCVFRTIASCETTDPTAVVVASCRKP